MIDATPGPDAAPSNTHPAAARQIGVRPGLLMAIFLIVFTVALALDVPVSTAVHQSPNFTRFRKICQDYDSVRYSLRFFGNFWFTLFAASILLIRDWQRRVLSPETGRDALVVLLAGIFSWINQPLKWCVGRFRPFHVAGMGPFNFHPFLGGLHGLIKAEGPLSFPSGDTTLAFAMAASLSFADPRRQLLWWTLGIWIALERIAEGAHYPSDTVAGAALGIGLAIAARKIVSASIRKRQGKM
jgi:membrane-associated phospholipid phosphatase